MIEDYFRNDAFPKCECGGFVSTGNVCGYLSKDKRHCTCSPKSIPGCENRMYQDFDWIKIAEITHHDVEEIEDLIGCAHGAWDMEDPREIIAKALCYFIDKSNT